jgi:hypothetical protein
VRVLPTPSALIWRLPEFIGLLGAVAFARKDRKAGILEETGIRESEVAEDEDGATGRLDPPGMKTIGAEAGTLGVWLMLLRIRHEKFPSTLQI